MLVVLVHYQATALLFAPNEQLTQFKCIQSVASVDDKVREFRGMRDAKSWSSIRSRCPTGEETPIRQYLLLRISLRSDLTFDVRRPTSAYLESPSCIISIRDPCVHRLLCILEFLLHSEKVTHWRRRSLVGSDQKPGLWIRARRSRIRDDCYILRPILLPRHISTCYFYSYLETRSLPFFPPDSAGTFAVHTLQRKHGRVGYPAETHREVCSVSINEASRWISGAD